MKMMEQKGDGSRNNENNTSSVNNRKRINDVLVEIIKIVLKKIFFN